MNIKITLVLLMTLCAALLAHAAQEGELAAGMVNPGHQEKPAWFKLSFLDLREDVEEAKAAGKGVVLYFYQDGCPYCAKLLQDNFSQKAIVDKTRKNFDVIAVNMWGDREITDLQGEVTLEKAFAESLRVMFTPTLLFLDGEGRVVLRINGYFFPARFDAALDYVAEGLYRQVRFSDYIKQRNPVKATGRLHMDARFIQPPYDLSARKSDRPLLVLFEQAQCGPCDEMHLDIFKRKELQEQLQHFDIMLLDIHGKTPVITPEGKPLTSAEWARELDIRFAPSMLFLDTAGKEVFRTEAYLRAFHQQTAMSYVHTGAYKQQPSFQRYVQAYADDLRARGIEVDIMK